MTSDYIFMHNLPEVLQKILKWSLPSYVKWPTRKEQLCLALLFSIAFGITVSYAIYESKSLSIVPEPGLNEQSIKEEYHKIPPALIDAIRIQVFDGRQVSNYAIVLVYKFACKVVFNAKQRLSANNNEVDAEIIQMIFADQAVVNHFASSLMTDIERKYTGHTRNVTARPWLCISRSMLTLLAMREHENQQQHVENIAKIITCCERDRMAVEDAMYELRVEKGRDDKVLSMARCEELKAAVKNHAKPGPTITDLIERRVRQVEGLVVERAVAALIAHRITQVRNLIAKKFAGHE